MKRISIIVFISLISFTSFAQRRGNLDTSKPTTVVVTSQFKPVLRPSAKINFVAAVPSADTARPNLFYTIPSQNLFFVYQPTPLKPLALNVDSAIAWVNHNYIKAGFGNYTTPYLQAGFTMGDGKNGVLNINAKHVASKGKLPFQQFSNTNISALAVINAANNNEFTTKIHVDNSNQYFYGYQPSTLTFTKDQLRQRFTSFGGRVALRNKDVNAPLSYNPAIGLEFFNDNHSGVETTLSFDAPVSKDITRMFAFNVGLHGSLTNLKTQANSKIKNNLFWLDPAVQFKTPNLVINAGFNPTWDNSVFIWQPNFWANAKLRDEKFVLQLGWTGYYLNNTYQSLAAFNPWIAQPTFLSNTSVREQFAGFKGSAGNHLTYNARVSYLNYSNMPLFINDNVDGKTFTVLNEPEMKAIRIHGELGYTIQEKFSFLAGATFNQYSNLKVNDKSYGLLPLELTGSLRWQILKELSFKSDLFFWNGALYKTQAGTNERLGSAIDLNAGAELAITPKFSGFLQFNNIFNNQYQRWNQYQVLGFNVLGGIVYSFSKTANK